MGCVGQARCALPKWAVVFSLAILLAACGAPHPLPPEQQHTRSSSMQPLQRPLAYRVVRGDTLYSIAFRYGLDWRELAHWNNIGPPYTIRVDQWVRLMPPPAMQTAVRPAATQRPPTRTAEPSPPASRTGPGAPSGTGSDRPPAGSTATGSSTAPAQPPAPSSPAPESPPPSRQAASTPDPAPRPATADSAVRPVQSPTATRSVAGVAWGWPSEGRVARGFDASAARKGILIGGTAGQPVRAAAEGEVVYSGSGLIGYGELIIIKHSDRMLSAYGHNRERLVREGDRVRAGELIAHMGRNEADQEVLHFEIRRDGRPENPINFLPPR